MEDVATAEKAQTKEHLVRIGSDSAQVESDIATEFLEYFAQVHAEIFKDHAKMALVFEVAEKFDDMLLIFRIGCSQFV